MGDSPVRDSLKVVSQFDWVSPMICVGLSFAGYRPVYVQDDSVYDAARIMGQEPLDFDLWLDSWVFMVRNNDYNRVMSNLRKMRIVCQ